jgi:hypothetical protein
MTQTSFAWKTSPAFLTFAQLQQRVKFVTSTVRILGQVTLKSLIEFLMIDLSGNDRLKIAYSRDA